MAITRVEIYHNLSVLLDSGLGLDRSLRMAVSGLRGRLADAFAGLAESVSAGNGLAESMAGYPKVFPQFDLMIVEAGQNSGNLPSSLEGLSQWYALRKRTTGMFISAMMLPVVIFHAAALLGPLPSLFLGAVSPAGYFQSVVNILLMMYVPVAVIWAIVRLRIGFARRLIDALALKIPLFGKAIRYLSLHRYCCTFHMLYSAGGLSLLQCTQSATDTVGNTVICKMLEGGIRSVSRRNPVSEGFSPKLPAEFTNAWRVAEESGKLDEVTKRLADSAAQRAQELFHLFSTYLPRLVYLLICLHMAGMILSGWSMIVPKL